MLLNYTQKLYKRIYLNIYRNNRKTKGQESNGEEMRHFQWVKIQMIMRYYDDHS